MIRRLSHDILLKQGLKTDETGNKSIRSSFFGVDAPFSEVGYSNKWKPGPDGFDSIHSKDIEYGVQFNLIINKKEHIMKTYHTYISSDELFKGPNTESGIMGKHEDCAWNSIENCKDVLLTGLKERVGLLIDALIAERQKCNNVSRIEAIFSLYSDGSLETDDVLRAADFDFYDFRKYLNDHKIPYRYEDGFIDNIEGFEELL